MTIDALAPTRERLARSKWLAPETSRDVQRVAWRAVCAFERLHNLGKLEHEQVQAGRKFRKHYLGSLGVDVREDDGGGYHDAAEHGRTYHAQMTDRARRAMTPRQFSALVLLVEEDAEARSVGELLARVRDEKSARTAGTVLVQEALTMVALHWGLQSHPPTRR
jgi:hypothetical protein